MLREEEASRLARNSVPLSEDLDDLITTLEMEGVDLSPESKLPSERRSRTDSEFDLAHDENAGKDALDKTSDPVKLYLRQMGTVPLLPRAGEVALAKRFERGHMRTLKAVSRSPIGIQEIIARGTELEQGMQSIRNVVGFRRRRDHRPHCYGSAYGNYQQNQRNQEGLQGCVCACEGA